MRDSGAGRVEPTYVPVARVVPPPWEAPDGVRISRIDVQLTAPDQVNLVVVRVHTSDDGLYGVGCATFTQRAHAVKQAIDEYLAPLVVGRHPADSTDLWTIASVDSYWRSGPVLNSAIAGIDMALWDIKGKQAGMPVWQLLGGRVRSAVDVYAHATGTTVAELVDQIDQRLEAGYRYVRCQANVPGTSTYGAAPDSAEHTFWDPDAYVAHLPRVFEQLTERYEGRARFLHDVHERLHPHDALRLIKRLDPFDLFFVEDPVAPEDLGWLHRIRDQTTVPLAMGELLTSSNDYLFMVHNRLVDFVRCHVSAIGGITPAWKLANLTEAFGMKTAWHGPRDVSPIGHAANLALDTASPAFGIHEHSEFSAAARDVFPGTPVARNGRLTPSDTPGLGVDVDDAAAAANPPVSTLANWHYSRVRRTDGAVQRP